MAVQKETTFSLKDHLYNKQKVEFLAGVLKSTYTALEKKKFIQKTVDGFSGRELKERMHYMTEMLEEFLPKDYTIAVEILKASLPKEVKGEDFIFSCYTNYVAKHGCNKKDLQYSLEALGIFTRYFSAEFAIRDFLNKFPQETLKQVHTWAKSAQTNQRRLASEGTRPKLPWAPNISLEYTDVVSVLDQLWHKVQKRGPKRSFFYVELV